MTKREQINNRMRTWQHASYTGKHSINNKNFSKGGVNTGTESDLNNITTDTMAPSEFESKTPNQVDLDTIQYGTKHIDFLSSNVTGEKVIFSLEELDGGDCDFQLDNKEGLIIYKGDEKIATIPLTAKIVSEKDEERTVVDLRTLPVIKNPRVEIDIDLGILIYDGDTRIKRIGFSDRLIAKAGRGGIFAVAGTGESFKSTLAKAAAKYFGASIDIYGETPEEGQLAFYGDAYVFDKFSIIDSFNVLDWDIRKSQALMEGNLPPAIKAFRNLNAVLNHLNMVSIVVINRPMQPYTTNFVVSISMGTLIAKKTEEKNSESIAFKYRARRPFKGYKKFTYMDADEAAEMLMRDISSYIRKDFSAQLVDKDILAPARGLTRIGNNKTTVDFGR